MNTKSIITIEGKDYDAYDFSLTSNGIISEDKKTYKQAINLTLTPLRRNESNELEVTDDLTKRTGVRTFDILTQHPRIQQAFYEIEQIIQSLINDGIITQPE